MALIKPNSSFKPKNKVSMSSSNGQRTQCAQLEMKLPGSCLLLLVLSSFHHSINALSDAEASGIAHRQLVSLPPGGDLPNGYSIKVNNDLDFQNDRLKRAYVALQAWKKTIDEDPKNVTSNWVGADVCSYNGVFCAPSLDDPAATTVVAGIDLNHADIAGFLPVELGLLTDLAIIHLNSNRFCGVIPTSLKRLRLLYELDVSNNRLVGSFPDVVLQVPCLKYLDLRYNQFQGVLPKELFDMDLDALFLNNNKFCDKIPHNLGNSRVSVVVLANNELTGCIPSSIGNMSRTINEINLANNGLVGCLPSELGRLRNVTVLDISNNSFSGKMPSCFKGLRDLEVVDVSCNRLTGAVPDLVCKLPKLRNVSIEYNYFSGLGRSCEAARTRGVALDESGNCLPGTPNQRDVKQCKEVISKPIDCGKAKCAGSPHPTPPLTQSPPPPPPPEVDSTYYASTKGAFGWHFNLH